MPFLRTSISIEAPAFNIHSEALTRKIVLLSETVILAIRVQATIGHGTYMLYISEVSKTGSALFGYIS